MDTVWHPTKGRGVVLGKYTLSENVKNEVVDYDVKEITEDKDSEMYKDALELAKQTGLGYSELDFNKLFPDMEEVLNQDYNLDKSQIQEIVVPDVPETF